MSEVLTLVRINIMVSWNVTPCSMVHRYQWFWDTRSRHVKDRRSKPSGNVSKTLVLQQSEPNPSLPYIRPTYHFLHLDYSLYTEDGAEGSLKHLQPIYW